VPASQDEFEELATFHSGSTKPQIFKQSRESWLMELSEMRKKSVKGFHSRKIAAGQIRPHCSKAKEE
jgi:hypothetical protein